MPDLQDGQTAEIQGSAAKPYTIKNVGGVYSCSCPAWCNQSLGIERRTCKHLRQFRGEQAEAERTGQLPLQAIEKSSKPKLTVPGLLLAQSWDNDMDVTGWWLSEKLDGVRAFWMDTTFSRGRGICSMPQTGSARNCPKCHSTASCGWPERAFNAL